MAEPNEHAAFKAGLFIFAMAALAIVMVFLVRGYRGSIGDIQEVTVVFGPGDNAAAISAGSPVRIYGVGVGTVSETRVIPDDKDGALVEVVAHLPSGFTICEGAEVVAAASLTGESWLNFVTLGEGKALSADHQHRIRGGSGGFEKVLHAVDEVVPDVAAAVERVRRAAAQIDTLIAQLNEKFDPFTADVRELTSTTTHAAKQLDGLLGDTGGDLRSTFKGLAEVADSAKVRLPTLLDRIDALVADAGQSVEKIDPLLDRVGPVLGDTRAVVSDVRGLVRTNGPTLSRTASALERTALEAQGAVSEVRAAPWRLLYKPRERDQRNLALYAAAREYAAGAQDLEATAEALQIALETSGGSTVEADGSPTADLAELRRRVIESYENFEAAQTSLWQQFER